MKQADRYIVQQVTVRKTEIRPILAYVATAFSIMERYILINALIWTLKKTIINKLI